MAIGSRRTWPSPPAAAAVFSLDMVAPMNVPCCQSRACGHQRHGGLAPAAEQDRRDRHAVRVVPLGRDDRALRDRHGVARVRVGGGLVRFRGPVHALPRRQVLRLALHALPPDVAVVGEGGVGEDRVARGHRAHGVGVGLPVGAGRDAEEAELRVDGVEAAVVAEAHPGDVVADGLGPPAGHRGLQHGEVGLAAGARERGDDVVGLLLRRDQLEDQHVLGEPALVVRDGRRDAQRVALLAQQRVAAVAGAVAPDLAGLGEVRDVLGLVARPRDVGLALARAGRRPSAGTSRSRRRGCRRAAARRRPCAS